MKYFVFIQAVIYAFLFSTAKAQNENWDTYMAKFGDKPGSVLVDLSLIATAPDSKYPNLVITGPQAHHCDTHGLPDKDEIDALEEILDATNNFLSGVTPKVLVGTFTYNCERVNYYYVKDTANIRNAIMRMYNRGYKDYRYAINIKSDPEWTTYRTFLYPNDEMLNWMENEKIMDKMLEHGDSLTRQRNINFNLSFPSDSDMKAFADFAKEKGYKAIFIDPPFNTSTFRLVVSKYGYVKMDFINPLTTELKLKVKRYHGLYNGWEAPLPASPKPPR